MRVEGLGDTVGRVWWTGSGDVRGTGAGGGGGAGLGVMAGAGSIDGGEVVFGTGGSHGLVVRIFTLGTCASTLGFVVSTLGAGRGVGGSKIRGVGSEGGFDDGAKSGGNGGLCREGGVIGGGGNGGIGGT